ncbi:SLC5A9 [Bugula neritina]|uniref:SLC5A9 n=1 Tax=Bugula neritina TaxID=10212 RepID=A0A7J7IXR7_BUGNE|nr:SLC5A9 [Bugula neritina]
MSSSSEYDADSLLKNAKLVPWDFVVIAAYFVAIIGVGIWSSCRNRGSTKGYFLAGRSMHWIPVGASLFASNIGSGHFVGLAGSGASAGIGVAIFELSAAFVLLLLGWVFVPVYIASGVFTMPEYMRKRFGGQRIRVYLSSLSLILYIFTKISADLYSGAIFLEKAIGWGVYESTVALLFLALILTVAGGLSAVIWTDFAQTCIIIIGAAVLAVLSYIEAGGYNQIVSKFMGVESQPNLTRQCLSGALNSTKCRYAHCGIVPANSMHFFRPASDPAFPWTGMIFGLTISSIWYWCTDQVLWN